jgi:hypothetical protein
VSLRSAPLDNRKGLRCALACAQRSRSVRRSLSLVTTSRSAGPACSFSTKAAVCAGSLNSRLAAGLDEVREPQPIARRLLLCPRMRESSAPPPYDRRSSLAGAPNASAEERAHNLAGLECDLRRSGGDRRRHRVLLPMTEFRIRGGHEGEPPAFEIRVGESVERRTGRMLHRVRRIDCREDAYVERIFDPRTGETVHWCAEPLSEHRGHGSAKRRA